VGFFPFLKTHAILVRIEFFGVDMRFLILFLLSFSVAAAEINLSWQAPTLREDGSTIDSPISYRLYHVVDNIEQPVVELPLDTLSYNIPDAPLGTHTFQISAVEHGLEGAVSAPASKSIGGSRPGRITIIIE